MYALPERAITRNSIHHMDLFDLCNAMPSASVDMVLCDPPYYSVVTDEWDTQWATQGQFMAWISRMLAHFKRILKPNGSMYLFASHKLHAHVEVAVSRDFNVLNNIVWLSNGATTKRADRTILRSYIPTTEHIIFAEQKNGDQVADDISGFSEAERLLKKRIFGDYLRNELQRAGKTSKEIARLFPSVTGGLTGCVSNWLLGHNIPTKTQYQTIKVFLGSADYLRREYEALRREYEALRRPFDLDVAGENECNVWTFKPPSKRQHPTQKPVEMFEHILNVSTRPGELVFDPCVGSGTTAVAARNTGRDYICGDFTREYVELARDRVQNTDPYQPTVDKKTGLKQLSLFASGD